MLNLIVSFSTNPHVMFYYFKNIQTQKRYLIVDQDSFKVNRAMNLVNYFLENYQLSIMVMIVNRDNIEKNLSLIFQSQENYYVYHKSDDVYLEYNLVKYSLKYDTRFIEKTNKPSLEFSFEDFCNLNNVFFEKSNLNLDDPILQLALKDKKYYQKLKSYAYAIKNNLLSKEDMSYLQSQNIMNLDGSYKTLTYKNLIIADDIYNELQLYHYFQQHQTFDQVYYKGRLFWDRNNKITTTIDFICTLKHHVYFIIVSAKLKPNIIFEILSLVHFFKDENLKIIFITNPKNEVYNMRMSTLNVNILNIEDIKKKTIFRKIESIIKEKPKSLVDLFNLSKYFRK